MDFINQNHILQITTFTHNYKSLKKTGNVVQEILIYCYK